MKGGYANKGGPLLGLIYFIIFRVNKVLVEIKGFKEPLTDRT